MPFKSFSQLRKFASLVKQGKMAEKTFKEWLSHTDTAHLPERINKKIKKNVKKRIQKNKRAS